MLCTLTCGIITPNTAGAQSQEFQDTARRVSDYQKSLPFFSADFVQTRYFADMDEEVIFNGKVWYLAPDKIRWSYMRPDESHLIINGDNAWMLIPELEQCDRYNVKENPKLEFFVSFFSRGLGALGNFSGTMTNEAESNTQILRILPDPADNNLYQGVIVQLQEGGNFPASITVLETNGDKTKTRFINLDTKTKPDEKIFSVEEKEE